MSTDVAAFARQLREEGIEAARQEGEKLIEEARVKARQIVEDAEVSARKILEESQQEISRRRQRLEAELRLVARDLMLGLRRQMEAVAATLLKDRVARTLSSEEVLRSAIAALLKSPEMAQDWEMTVGPDIGKDLAVAIVNDLLKGQGAAVQVQEGFAKAGFQLKTAGGTEVIEVSAESVTEVFMRFIAPELRNIIDAKTESGS